MGMFGLKPFNNTKTLKMNEKFRKTKMAANNIMLMINESGINGAYEATALLVSTYEFGLAKQYVITKDIASMLLNIITKGAEQLTQNEKENINSHCKAWISTCTIELRQRNKLLYTCSQELFEVINDENTGRDLGKIDRENLINNMIDVYNTAQVIINTYYSKPILITENQFTKLVKAYENKPKTYAEQYAQVKCINKERTNGKITAYQLQDKQGETFWIQSEQLRDAMINHGFLVENLKITSNNRIISVK